MLASIVFLLTQTVGHATYDPLAVSLPKPEVLDLNFWDRLRNRDVPVRIYLAPTLSSPQPVIMFSHGLGGNREGSEFLGQHWARRGYVAVFLQHPGSDDSVWKDTPVLRRMSAMKRAANAENFLLRTQDVKLVLDVLTERNDRQGDPLFHRLTMDRVGMSGHSFGAVTTQAVSGQSFGRLGQQFTDQRITAAIAFSPNNPNHGQGHQNFGSVSIPWMLMTGTKDTAPIGNATVRSRLDVFPHLPSSIDRYQVVLFNAQHSVFTDRALPGDRVARNPNHHRAILALSTAFWDSGLRDNADARRWLNSSGPRTVLEARDAWSAQSAKR